MVNLLEKFSVRAGDAPIKLLKVIKNPVTNYLPPGCKKTLFTFKADGVVRPRKVFKQLFNPLGTRNWPDRPTLAGWPVFGADDVI